MKRYFFDKQGFYTGRSINSGAFDSYPVNTTIVSPPPLAAGQHARWNNSSWDIVTDKPVIRNVPQVVEIGKFKLALFDAGHLDVVAAHIAGLATNIRKRVQIQLDNGGDITLEQAKNLLDGVINETIVEDMFIEAKAL